MVDYSQVPSPCYVMEEELLRRNLSLIRSVKEQSGAEIIMAFKAFALWKAFPIIREYVDGCTASSPYEAEMAVEKFKSRPHTYSPAYTEENFPGLLEKSSHITFNSLSQYERFYPQVRNYRERHVSCGLRINPEFSEVETELYNPCAPGTRFGVTADLLPQGRLPEGIEGFHCHTLCESSAEDLEKMLAHVEEHFGPWLPLLKWLNLGGGHLMTRKGYNVPLLVSLLTGLRRRYPNLQVILEPGAAFVWQTGTLLASVVDIVENRGIRTAILDVSFTCHMPDCLEMPYQPVVRGASSTPQEGEFVYRLGGNSCLSGDYIGSWGFDHELQVGERIVFEDMIHYTTVKTNMFNGIAHPSIALWTTGNRLEIYRTYTYKDYIERMC